MFNLSKRSLDRLGGVHPSLIEVVIEAIKITPIDFGVSEGVRSIDTQRLYVAQGVSWTLNSKHLLQSDGYGHAVDVVAIFNKVASWDMRNYARIAEAFRHAADKAHVKIVWGGVWDMTLGELSLTGEGFNDDIDDYVKRFKSKYNRRPRLDGPHFELTQ